MSEIINFCLFQSPPTNHKSQNGKTSRLSTEQLSLEDVGNYDDEDEGDSAPPLPPWTEDALILVDPPPVKPKFNIYKTNAHLLPGASPKRSPHPFHTPPATRKDKVVKPVYTPQFSTPSRVPHHSPPHTPPTPPPKLYKAHSQGDGLDKIVSGSPPVPPPRPHKNHSPNFQPRSRGHHYEDIDTKKKLNYIDVDFTQNKKPRY